MASLKNVLKDKIAAYRQDVRKLIADFGDRSIGDVTVAQVYGGLRGVRALVCDTSTVSPDTGLIIRGRPLAELVDLSPEAMFWLLLTGDVPDDASLAELRGELAERAEVPDYVFNMLRHAPETMHPMSLQSLGVLALEKFSQFSPRYAEGMPKDEYWQWYLEDALDLLAKLPALTAGVYRIRYKDGKLIPRDPNKDWSENFAHMMGVPDESGNLADLFRLYLNLHTDHESGNVSANLCHTAGSALSNVYYAVSAGLNGLAGPLHGLANQNALKFQLEIREKFGGVPTENQLREYLWDHLNSGQVIPGFGHAVLRCTDPRYTACYDFGKKACPDAPLFQLAQSMLKVAPAVLIEQGKAKNPNPNVDALSGVLMYTFGVTEPPFYTAIFGVSRAVGMCAQLILNRGLGLPITRPKSVTTDWIKQHVGA